MGGSWEFGFSAEGAIEDDIDRASALGMDFVEFAADIGANAIETFDERRVREVRARTRDTGVGIAIHTSSAVNIAEVAPFFRDAVPAYLDAHIDLAARLGCPWIVVHGGYHFNSIEERRFDAAVDALNRASDVADERGVMLLLENHNREPDHAEMNYMPYTADGQARFMERLGSPALGFSFNIGHANLVTEGFDGFLDAVGVDRLGQLRLADNTGEYEIHVPPGEGNVDFDRLFARLGDAGWSGPSVLSFGPESARIAALERFRGIVG